MTDTLGKKCASAARHRHETWRERLLGYATVTATAALVWFWAANQTKQTSEVSFRLHFVPGSIENQFVGPDEPLMVRVQFSGSSSAVESAVEAVNGRTIDVAVGTCGIPSESGGHDVALADVIARIAAVADAGASVRSVQPPSTAVAVETAVRREATVTARFANARTAGQTTIEPAMVQVVVPATLAERLPASLVVDAMLTTEMLAHLEPGRRHQVEVPLSLPAELATIIGRARIDPSKARIVFTLTSTDATLTLKQVAVQIAAATGELAGRSISLAHNDEFLHEVVLAGPQDALRSIERGEAKVIAIVHLAREDFARRTDRKEISVWLLPAGVRVVSVNGVTTNAPSVGVEIAGVDNTGLKTLESKNLESKNLGSKNLGSKTSGLGNSGK